MNAIKFPRAELSGRYKLEVRRHGKLIHDTGWFDNLITNTGLNSMGLAREISRYAMVGTSNTAPAVTDTVLGAQIAVKDTSSAPSKTTSAGVEIAGTRYGWRRVSCPFAQGAVVGNVAEVGIGWTTTEVFSRSLVTPAISIIAIDQLTVVYELRMYLPTSNATGSVNIGGTTYNYTVRPNNAANSGAAGTSTRGWSPYVLSLGAATRAWVQENPFNSWWGGSVFGGPAAIQSNVESTVITTGDGSGASLPSDIFRSVTNATYSDNSLTCQFTMGLGINEGNIDGAQVWLARTSGTANNLKGVVFGAGLFVAVGAAGTVITSPDGITWTSRTSGTANALNAVTWSGSSFIAVGASGTIISSTDGITWTTESSGVSAALNGIKFGGGLFVAVGASGTILTSPTGVTWTSETSGTSSTLYAIAYGAAAYVAVGAGGLILSSSNAASWASRTSGTSSDLKAVGFGIGLFIAVGPTNFTTRSSDGFTWTTGSFGATIAPLAIAFTTILGVTVGTSSAHYRTSNGTSWLGALTSVAGTYNALTSGVKTFVAVGDSGAIITASTGGIQAITYSGIFGSYQCVLDSTIEKDNTKTLTLTFSQTWARRS